MALDPLNSSSLEQLALKGLILAKASSKCDMLATVFWWISVSTRVGILDKGSHAAEFFGITLYI